MWRYGKKVDKTPAGRTSVQIIIIIIFIITVIDSDSQSREREGKNRRKKNVCVRINNNNITFVAKWFIMAHHKHILARKQSANANAISHAINVPCGETEEKVV